MLPDLESLRCFDAAATHLNFRAAARALAMSPTAFGDRIKRLEELLGARLFERSTRRVMLTEAGQRLREHARRCIDAAARHSGFILSTSCEIPPRSNPEIVKWFMDAAHDYGRYERLLG